MDKLFTDVQSLYRLGQGTDSISGKKNLGKLPMEAVVLFASLITAWVLIILYVSVEYLKKKKTIDKKH